MARAARHTLVCFAVNEEAAPVARLLAGRRDIRILVTGMGAKNAERELRRALESGEPELVLTCGFAGALNPELPIGAAVFDVGTAPDLEPLLAKAGARASRFHCSPRVATTAEEKQQLRAEARADAVEMESGVIHAICRARRIPAATVRVISDSANEDLPLDFNTLMNEDDRLSYSKLAVAVLAAPQKIPALLRLQRRTRAAAENLARVVAAVVPE